MKPNVFNYQDYVNAVAEIDKLKAENEALKRRIANLEIKLRIVQTDKEEHGGKQ